MFKLLYWIFHILAHEGLYFLTVKGRVINWVPNLINLLLSQGHFVSLHLMSIRSGHNIRGFHLHINRVKLVTFYEQIDIKITVGRR